MDLQSFVLVTCAAHAGLAGLEWNETIGIRVGTVPPFDKAPHDRYFDTLGAWDAEIKQVVIDVERCAEGRSPHARDALIKVVVVHFCARAVVHLGAHPATGKTYVGWDDPRIRFASEASPRRPLVALQPALERERTLFSQILTYLYVISRHSQMMLEPFVRLSRGRFGLYDLDYTRSPFKLLVNPHLRRDWKEEAKADWKHAAAVMALVLGWLTREAPVPRNDSVINPFNT